MIDPMRAAALASAVERDLLDEVQRAVAAGFAPQVAGVHRSRSGIAVVLDLGDGVPVEREVQLDAEKVDPRIRLGVLEAAITSLVDAEAARQIAVASRAPIAVGSGAPR